MNLPTDREMSLTEALIWMAEKHRAIPEPKPCCADSPCKVAEAIGYVRAALDTTLAHIREQDDR